MSVYFSLNGKIKYYSCTKCASTTVISWLNIINDHNVYIDEPDMFSPIVNETTFNLHRRLHKKTKSIPQICFCLVRDPVERFVSAYTNRELFHNKNTKRTFDEYLNDILKKFDHHTTPQTHFYGKSPDIFTHIFNLKSIDKLKILLEDVSDIKLPSLKLQISGNFEKINPTYEQIQIIKYIYSEDYEIYGKWM
jgi:hypothetical protein